MSPEELARLEQMVDEANALPTVESLFEPKPNVEDVTFESLPSKYPKARQDLQCGECGARMELCSSVKFTKPFYGCTRYPECRGSHGAHADGAPLGKPANQETKRARIQAHAMFDQIWKQKLVTHRGAAYNWMRQVMGLTNSQAHIGEFDIQQCAELQRLVCRDYPTLKTVTDRLLYDDDPFGFGEDDDQPFPF